MLSGLPNLPANILLKVRFREPNHEVTWTTIKVSCLTLSTHPFSKHFYVTGIMLDKTKQYSIILITTLQLLFQKHFQKEGNSRK